MTIVLHKVPENVVGITPPTGPQGTFILQDVERVLYAQDTPVGNAARAVGWVPAQADGNGGIAQLMRGPDMRYNSNQSTTGFSATGNGSSGVTVNYPALSVMFDGSMQSFPAGSVTLGGGSGTISFGVAYQWGLTLFQSQAIDALPSGYVELCTLTLTTTSVTVGPARTSGNYMEVYGISVGNVQRTTAIPVSDQNGAMAW